MKERNLKLNESNIEIMLIKGNLRTNVTQEISNLDVEASTLAPVNIVQNLGIIFDPKLSFKKQTDMAVKNCNFQIRNLYAIRKLLYRKCLHVLVHSLVIPKTDYCNSLYVCLPNYLLRKLQSVINRSAIIIYSLPSQVPTTFYLIRLHWLPIKARIVFKICLLAFKVLKFNELRYLIDLLTLSCPENPSPSRPDDSSPVIQKKFISKNHNDLVSVK